MYSFVCSFPVIYKAAFSGTNKHFHSEDCTFQNLLRVTKRDASMGPRGSTVKNGARTLGSDSELSRGSVPALASRQPHRNRLAFLRDKALFCCLSGQGVLCSASRGSEINPGLHLQAGQTGWGRGQITV